MSKMEQALSAWNSIGEVQSAEHFGNGHINDTYLVQTKNQKRYILQRINTRTFQDVEGLMENIHLVTGHQQKGSTNRRRCAAGKHEPDSIRPRFVVS